MDRLAGRHDALAGLSGLVTVVGSYDVSAGESVVLWRAETESIGTWYPRCAAAVDGVVAVLDSYSPYAEILVIEDGGNVRSVVKLEHPGAVEARWVGGHLSSYRWTAPDGLDLEGLLVTPEGGKTSECAIYPDEGHGIRGFPAVIDQLARMLRFLRTHCGGHA